MVDYEIWDYPMANIKYDHKIIFNSCNTETLEQINLKVSFIATLFHTLSWFRIDFHILKSGTETILNQCGKC